MSNKQIAIIGAGPAGLACAEWLSEHTPYDIIIYEQKPSAARKFLMAGKTGLNISHNEDFAQFIARYDQADWLTPMLQQYSAPEILTWMSSLGIESYVGSSGRIFPKEMKAAPLLRAWLQRLKEKGVKLFYRHQVSSLSGPNVEILDLKTQQSLTMQFDAVVLACGAVSWPQLGSDGQWQAWLDRTLIQPFAASNVGVQTPWSNHMQPYWGYPLKRIQAWVGDEARQFGEMVISHYGLEGGLVYRCNRALRSQLQQQNSMILSLDLLPDLSLLQVTQRLQQTTKQSLNTLWQKAGLGKAKIALLRDIINKSEWNDPIQMAQYIKCLKVTIAGFRPIEEAISCSGGVQRDALDHNLMLKNQHGVFACGEMLDWDAPTGGYLLTACLATGRAAGHGVQQFLH